VAVWKVASITRRVGEAKRNPPDCRANSVVGFASLHPPYSFANRLLVCLAFWYVVFAGCNKKARRRRLLSGDGLFLIPDHKSGSADTRVTTATIAYSRHGINKLIEPLCEILGKSSRDSPRCYYGSYGQGMDCCPGIHPREGVGDSRRCCKTLPARDRRPGQTRVGQTGGRVRLRAGLPLGSRGAPSRWPSDWRRNWRTSAGARSASISPDYSRRHRNPMRKRGRRNELASLVRRVAMAHSARRCPWAVHNPG
jgi:hypothetical protein